MTERSAALARLRATLGRDELQEHEPLTVEGCTLDLTLRPASVEALGALLRLVHENAGSLLVRGGGTRLDLGNVPRHVDAILATSGLAAVRELDAEEGVLHAEAGVPVAKLGAAAAEVGWELPLDPPGAESTLGGALAAAAMGPCFGHPRDVVLGLEVVLATGARTHCGGRVVKNVTGYDLAKLHVGALGTLGVIGAAWLRLRPRPEAREVWLVSLSGAEDGAAHALEAARLPTARAAVSLHGQTASGLPASGDPLLVIELAGDAPAVERDAAWLRGTLGAEAADASILERMRELQAAAGEGVLRFRVSSLPGRLGAVASSLASAGAILLAHPARGLVWARFTVPAGDARAVETAAEVVARAAQAGRGHALLESAPVWARRGRDVFGGVEAVLPLTRALKEQYDPTRVLNPGRFAGHL